MKTTFSAQMLQVYFGEQDHWNGKPLHAALIEKCMTLGIAGATVCRGIAGFGASSSIHRKHLWSFSNDAPMIVTIIDTPEQLTKLTSALQEMVEEGVVICSNVEAIRYDRGARVAHRGQADYVHLAILG